MVHDLYTYVDKIFTKSFFTLVSWSGLSKTEGKPKAQFSNYRFFKLFFSELMRKTHKEFSDTDYEDIFKNKLIKNSTSRAKSLGKRKSAPKYRSSQPLVEADEKQYEEKAVHTVVQDYSHQADELQYEEKAVHTVVQDSHQADELQKEVNSVHTIVQEPAKIDVDKIMESPKAKRVKKANKRKVTTHRDMMILKNDLLVDEVDASDSELDFSEVSGSK